MAGRSAAAPAAPNHDPPMRMPPLPSFAGAPFACAVLAACLPALACSSNEIKFDEEKQLELYMTTATYLYQDDSLVRAQDQAVKALQIDPENRPMRRMIGWIRLRMGSTNDLITAEQFFRKLLAEGDDDTPVLLGLATAQERLGVAHDQAAKAIRSGERYSERSDPAEHADELQAQAAKLWEESYENYQRVVQGATQRDKAMNGLQRVAALRRDYEESLRWGQSLLQLCSTDIEFWRNALESQDLSQTKEQVFRESIDAAIELQVDTLLLSTSMLHRLGRTGDALASLALAAELAPSRPALYSQRAQLHAEVGRFAEAIEDVETFLRLSKQPFEDPNVRRAFELRTHCEEELLKQGLARDDE
jgi:tetratricopeptide (TPR) repeat protein